MDKAFRVRYIFQYNCRYIKSRYNILKSSIFNIIAVGFTSVAITELKSKGTYSKIIGGKGAYSITGSILKEVIKEPRVLGRYLGYL